MRAITLLTRLRVILSNPAVASRPIILFLIVTATMFGTSGGVPPSVPDVNLPLIYGLARWDSGFYMGIAVNGYGTIQHSFSFRPLFPLILKILYPAFFWLDTRSAEVAAGLIWNLVALAIAAIYLAKLTDMLFNHTIANRTLLLLSIYPSTFFFTVIYSEATCILFIATSLYCLETKRPIIGGMLGFLAGLTRPEAFLVAIPFLAKALFEDQKITKILGGLIALASVPAFAVYAYLQTGSLLTPFQSELSAAKCTVICFVGNPVANFANGVLPYSINFVTFSLAAFLVAGALLRGKSSERSFPYYLWAFVVLAIMFYAGEARSLARFALVLPPVFWAQAEYSVSQPRLFQGLVVVYSVLMCLAIVLFVNWYPML